MVTWGDRWVLRLRLNEADLRNTGHACHWVLYDWFSLPIVNPLFLFVQIGIDHVDLGEGSVLDLSSLLVSRTVLDVVKVVLVGLHADLAVGVLLVRDRLQ